MFNSDYTFVLSVAGLTSTKFVVGFSDGTSPSFGTAIIGDVSGTSISFGPEHVFNSGNTPDISVAALSSTKFVVGFNVVGYFGTAMIGDNTSSHFIGIAKESREAGQIAPVIINGVSDVHAGLTRGEIYYSDLTGALTTSVTDWRAGLAISSTELFIHSNFDNIDEFFNDMVFNNNFRITEASDYEGLIFKNHLNHDILTLSEEGHLNAAKFTSNRIGIGTENLNSALEVNGYIELDTVSGSPPAADCDHSSERGRIKADDTNSNLYLCTSGGWVTK